MQHIGLAEIEPTYRLAKEFKAGKITQSQAVGTLVNQYHMNKRSAAIYLATVRHMLSGARYTQTINNTAVSYFLDSIRNDFGDSTARLALESLNAHIDYYHSVQTSQTPELCEIANKFQKLLDSGDSVAEFEKAVQQSLQLSEIERHKLLPPPGHKPPKGLVTISVFQRNQHVVAEVLMRAKGNCEDCGLSAPFVRRTNGQPYLEVHHRKTLASGGDDTVENAIALCPNCHRKSHFG